jgi:hypothetical protein
MQCAHQAGVEGDGGVENCVDGCSVGEVEGGNGHHRAPLLLQRRVRLCVCVWVVVVVVVGSIANIRKVHRFDSYADTCQLILKCKISLSFSCRKSVIWQAMPTVRAPSDAVRDQRWPHASAVPKRCAAAHAALLRCCDTSGAPGERQAMARSLLQQKAGDFSSHTRTADNTPHQQYRRNA